MNVAILHFHLRRGGVTSVMLKQAASLARLDGGPKVVFVAGTTPEVATPVPSCLVPSLDYDAFTGAEPSEAEAGALALASELETTLNRAFPTGCDLLHVHNPNLCKNSRLLGALHHLQERGQAILVQVHDLAEDFRPEVYETRWPYLGSCDYVTINRRDRNHLVAAGLKPEQVWYLPNPVSPVDGFEARQGWRTEVPLGRSTLLYPVRGIRRKNLGEALLLSQFLPPGTDLAVTLPPTSPRDRIRYEDWMACASRSRLPIRFGVGLKATLRELYDRSFAAVTTSVKEGFGYSYLDPMVLGLPVVGRRLPAVVDDFEAAGLSFEPLYSSIDIPRSWLPESEVRRFVERSVTLLRTAYSLGLSQDGRRLLETALSEIERRMGGLVLDFGALNELLQRHVLTRVTETRTGPAELLEQNPLLSSLFDVKPSFETSVGRRDLITRAYSEEQYGEQLFQLYRTAAARKPQGTIDRALFLRRYLTPEAFSGVAL